MYEKTYYKQLKDELNGWRIACLIIALIAIGCIWLFGWQADKKQQEIVRLQLKLADLDYDNWEKTQRIKELEEQLTAAEAVLKLRTDKEMLVEEVARAYDLPVGFVTAIMQREGAGPNTISRMNKNGTRDRGIMQLNDAVFPTPHWFTPEVNVNLACFLIASLRNTFRGNWWQVAMAYNCGIVPVMQGQPPSQSVEYAGYVLDTWRSYNPYEYFAMGGK